MVSQEREPYLQRFRRIVLSPFWCQGSPLDWVDTKTGYGIAHYALEGKVGHFNLCWWMLSRTEPPLGARAYTHTKLKWVILRAPNIYVRKWSLTDWASFMTLEEWERFVLSCEKIAPRFEGEGVTYEEFKLLALRGRKET